jgi:hypothetical protein
MADYQMPQTPFLDALGIRAPKINAAAVVAELPPETFQRLAISAGWTPEADGWWRSPGGFIRMKP